MGKYEIPRNSNSALVAAIVVLTVLNMNLLTSEVDGAVRYSLGTIVVVSLLVCVVLINRNVSRSPDVKA